MKFNKCSRCGCFFSNPGDICPNCISKDTIEKQKLENYLNNYYIPETLKQLSYNTGITEKNLNRFMECKEFSYLKNNIL